MYLYDEYSYASSYFSTNFIAGTGLVLIQGCFFLYLLVHVCEAHTPQVSRAVLLCLTKGTGEEVILLSKLKVPLSVVIALSERESWKGSAAVCFAGRGLRIATCEKLQAFVFVCLFAPCPALPVPLARVGGGGWDGRQL